MRRVCGRSECVYMCGVSCGRSRKRAAVVRLPWPVCCKLSVRRFAMDPAAPLLATTHPQRQSPNHPPTIQDVEHPKHAANKEGGAKQQQPQLPAKRAKGPGGGGAFVGGCQAHAKSATLRGPA